MANGAYPNVIESDAFREARHRQDRIVCVTARRLVTAEKKLAKARADRARAESAEIAAQRQLAWLRNEYANGELCI